MCGIVAAASHRDVVPMLLEGLRRLEYRGYDSCGVATLDQGVLKRARTVSRVHELVERVAEDGVKGTVGIAHTRWATHGAPEVCNAHPHISRNRIALVHNGIIENHEEIRRELQAKGYEFTSQTDTEVVAHLINDNDNGDLLKAVMTAVTRLRGSYAIAVIAADEPDRVIAARQGSPMVVGVGDGENFIASDAMAVGGTTDRIVYVHEGDVVDVRPDSWQVYERTEAGEFIPADREVKVVHAYAGAVELGPYRHFMQKEIFEQPKTIVDCIRGRINPETHDVILSGIMDNRERFLNARRIIFVACGTSWHASLIGEYLIEDFCRIPVEVEYASEFRYRNPVIYPDDIVIAVSQSGETADTLAAIELAKQNGAFVYGICNVIGSSIARATDSGTYIHVGPEIGVASTKAFTGQVTVLTMLALMIARVKGTIDQECSRKIAKHLLDLPAVLEEVLRLNDRIADFSKIFTYAHNFIYLGRGYNYPTALEGALKLKEISYIHAEGYPAAEMKHGPIALIDAEMPTIAIATPDHTYEKTASNIEEIKARGGKVITVIAKGDEQVRKSSDYFIEVPVVAECLMPIVVSVPLQLLAYHIAVNKGRDVDQPRNLAKSVTVE